MVGHVWRFRAMKVGQDCRIWLVGSRTCATRAFIRVSHSAVQFPEASSSVYGIIQTASEYVISLSR